MPEVPFHATQAGHRFYRHTMPELLRQIARLNDTLERLVAALPASADLVSEPPESDDPPAADSRRTS